MILAKSIPVLAKAAVDARAGSAAYTCEMQYLRALLAFTLVPLAVAILFNGAFWLFYTYVRGMI